MLIRELLKLRESSDWRAALEIYFAAHKSDARNFYTDPSEWQEDAGPIGLNFGLGDEALKMYAKKEDFFKSYVTGTRVAKHDNGDGTEDVLVFLDKDSQLRHHFDDQYMLFNVGVDWEEVDPKVVNQYYNDQDPDKDTGNGKLKH